MFRNPGLPTFTCVAEASRRVIEPVLSEPISIAREEALPRDRPAVSFDAFEQQQKIMLDGQERALEIHNRQMEKTLALSEDTARKTQAMLDLLLAAAADLTAQAVKSVEEARARAKTAAKEAETEATKTPVGPLLDAVVAWAREKGFVQ